jgi:hypothetical protein
VYWYWWIAVLVFLSATISSLWRGYLIWDRYGKLESRRARRMIIVQIVMALVYGATAGWIAFG